MRPQWCREHIDETAKHCGLSDDTVSDVKRAAKLCASAPEYSDCSTAAIMALIRIRDDPVRDKAISSISNALKLGKHPLTGQIMKDKKLPEKTIKKVIQQIELEVRGELTKKYEQEKKTAPKKPPYNGTPQPGDYPAPPAPMAQTLKEKYGGQEPVPEHGRFKDADNPEMISPPPNVEKPPCQEGKPCPAGRNYLIIQPTLGNKCEQTGGLIKNVTICPVIQRQRAAEANGAIFTTAGQIKPASDERPSDVLPRAKPQGPRELLIRFEEKQWNVLKQIVRENQAETLEDAVLFLVDEAGERMEGS